MTNEIDALLEIMQHMPPHAFDEQMKKYIQETEDADLFLKKSSCGKTLLQEFQQTREELLCGIMQHFPHLNRLQDSNKNTCLHHAAQAGFENACLLALEAEPSLAEIQNVDGATFLHLAANRGMSKVCLLALDVNPKAMEIQDDEGNTPLHYAAWRGLKDICLLAESMERFNCIKNNNFETFKSVAQRSGIKFPSQQKQFETLEDVLLARKTQIKCKDNPLKHTQK